MYVLARHIYKRNVDFYNVSIKIIEIHPDKDSDFFESSLFFIRIYWTSNE